MISAKDARTESNVRKTLNEIYKDLEFHIKDASSNGFFSTQIGVAFSLSYEVRTILVRELEGLGYNVTLTDFRNCDGPIDQVPQGDDLFVSWNE